MSKMIQKIVTCPKCGVKNNKDLYESINVTVDDSLRLDVLNGKILFHLLY